MAVKLRVWLTACAFSTLALATGSGAYAAGNAAGFISMHNYIGI